MIETDIKGVLTFKDPFKTVLIDLGLAKNHNTTISNWGNRLYQSPDLENDLNRYAD